LSPATKESSQRKMLPPVAPLKVRPKKQVARNLSASVKQGAKQPSDRTRLVGFPAGIAATQGEKGSYINPYSGENISIKGLTKSGNRDIIFKN